jgi:thiol:disulfide interchange protein DsbD
MRHLRVILLAVAFAMAGQAFAAPVNSGHVQLELVPQASSIAPGQTLYVALRQKIAKGWHTYWRNPGDAGDPPKIGWTLPAGWTAGDIVWPMPKRLPVGPLMDYGYEDEVLLPVPITAPKGAPVGRPAHLKAAVSLLVCKDICVPEDAVVTLDLPVAASSGRPNPEVRAVLDQAPRPARLDAAFALQGGRLKLAVAGAALKGVKGAGAYFYPYDSTVIDHPKAQLVERGPDGLTLSIAPGYAFTKGTPPKTLAGVLATDGRAYEITARRGAAPKGAAGLGAVAAAGAGKGRDGGGGGGDLGLPLAAAFAFLGGLVLNLMPCVFPILSMKALALTSHAREDARPATEGLAFTAGVLATFMGLAAVLIAAKAAGAAVGWGFQLQSPAVVAALALVMLLIGLNLSGVFEAGTSLQGLGVHRAHSVVGSLLTGALAVIVAAPCTAPFMASAIAYAFTQSEWAALAVFAALGLGFAGPFLLLSLLPQLRRRLPKPGAWMEALKKIFAFPMYAAAAWLAWVLTLQSGPTALAALLGAGVALALGAWLYGWAQQRQASGGRPILLYGLSLAAVAVACAAAAAGLNAAPPTAQAEPSGGGTLAAEPYSPETLAALQAQGRPVFVDFTAAWCITCQVNEQVALSSPKVAAAFARAKAAYLKADWTRRDPAIARALAEHGRAGVPLYLVYGAGGGEPVTLPQVLTEGTVISAVQKAAAKAS